MPKYCCKSTAGFGLDTLTPSSYTQCMCICHFSRHPREKPRMGNTFPNSVLDDRRSGETHKINSCGSPNPVNLVQGKISRH